MLKQVAHEETVQVRIGVLLGGLLMMTHASNAVCDIKAGFGQTANQERAILDGLHCWGLCAEACKSHLKSLET
jgi:hypothetical protein